MDPQDHSLEGAPETAPSGLRLCLVFPHLVLGGGETAMMALGEGLRARFDLAVCALNRRPLTVEMSAGPEISSRFPGAAFVTTREELAACLAGADLVLWYGLAPLIPSVIAELAPRPVSVRVVHTDKDEEGSQFQARWQHVLDGVVCVAPAVARRITGAAFIPNTCSPDRLAGERRELFPDAQRRRRPTLGFLGRLLPLKNISWVVENLAALGCNLAIQGVDTPELSRRDLEALARERGVAERVCFLPPGPQVGSLLRSIDALLIVSRQEGFPVVAVEAGMLGVPVIATPVGALPEIFAGELLFVAHESDGTPSLAGLRQALDRLDPSWGRRLQAKVESLCAPEVVARRYAALLEGLWRQRNGD
ncbi:MAG TPA: glycosyltransferase family 4 protein [Thermoanaerobaculia bacterium]|nr:glycosyltransferase family 4 protein [Thermoanaerobaculia bacterium]